MNALMGFVVLGTSIWMAADAAQLDYDKRDLRGLAAMGPVSWLFAGLLLWIVAFPLYLIKRNELKAAGERRRQLMAAETTPRPLPPSSVHAPDGIMGAEGAFVTPYVQRPFTPAQPSQPQPPPQPPSPPASIDEVVEQIQRLDDLRRSGILTDAEFQHKKTELLART